ncbi:MAG: hypothetical protein M0P41_11280, partial [Sphaerochaeta sp.]|nr:hypothetical protein [Sphaerochaeta sp.]
KENFMKKIIEIASLLLLVSGIIFAGGATEHPAISTDKATSSGVTEIVFLSSSVKPYDVAMPIMIANFEKENPDIKVKLEMLPTKVHVKPNPWLFKHC